MWLCLLNLIYWLTIQTFATTLCRRSSYIQQVFQMVSITDHSQNLIERHAQIDTRRLAKILARMNWICFCLFAYKQNNTDQSDHKSVGPTIAPLTAYGQPRFALGQAVFYSFAPPWRNVRCFHWIPWCYAEANALRVKQRLSDADHRWPFPRLILPSK